MKFGSVCSGIEAASVAWQPLGWKAQWFSEIEPFPCALLKHHYPATPNLGDMTQFESWPTDDQHAIDLLCGGTPCQSFSVAGLRAGLDDPRGNLMLTFGAIAAKYRPQWLVWENVPGVLSSNGGRDFGAFLGMLGQLGYGFAYRVLDAQYFGVAQRRRRVFVVGYSGDWRRSAAVLFERHSLQGHPAPGREKGKVAPTIPSRSTAGGGLGTDFDLDGGTICVATGQAGAEIGAEMAPTLNCNHEQPIVVYAGQTRACEFCGYEFDDKLGRYGCPNCEGQGPDVTHTLRGEGFDASEDGTGRGTPLVPVATCRDCGAQLEIGWGQWCDFCGHDQTEPRAYRTAGDGAVFEEGDITAPLTTGTDPCANIITDAMPSHVYSGGMGGRVDAVAQGFAQPIGMQVRRLTPEECESLQGFKRGYTLVPHRGKPAADGPRYKALGNSWAVPNVRWIGKRIEAAALINPAQPATETIAKPTPETELSA